MTAPRGHSPGAGVDPHDPMVIAIAFLSSLQWSPAVPRPPVVEAGQIEWIAARIIERFEHGGYPLSCIHNGQAFVSSADEIEAMVEYQQALEADLRDLRNAVKSLTIIAGLDLRR